MRKPERVYLGTADADSLSVHGETDSTAGATWGGLSGACCHRACYSDATLHRDGSHRNSSDLAGSAYQNQHNVLRRTRREDVRERRGLLGVAREAWWPLHGEVSSFRRVVESQSRDRFRALLVARVRVRRDTIGREAFLVFCCRQLLDNIPHWLIAQERGQHPAKQTQYRTQAVHGGLRQPLERQAVEPAEVSAQPGRVL